jgi:hypothetical protein
MGECSFGEFRPRVRHELRLSDRSDEAGSNSRCCDLCFVGRLCRRGGDMKSVALGSASGNFCKSESIHVR